MEYNFEHNEIVIKYLRQEKLTPEEAVVLEQLLNDPTTREAVIQQFTENDPVRGQLSQLSSIDTVAAWDTLVHRLQDDGVWPDDQLYAGGPVIRSRRRYRRFTYRFAATLVLAVGAWWVWQQGHRTTPVVATPAPIVAMSTGVPGGNKAILTLSDGRQVNLDESANGTVADQGNVQVSKLSDGKLAYNALQKPAIAVYNTLATPRAGQFSVSLPDGTKVWLNNASSLRYPVYFVGDTREVELTGEAYFEVAKDVRRPFRVKVRNSGAGEDGGTIEVLGTSFNVMAYSDEEATRATLVDGSIRFVRQGNSRLLRPGEQSVARSEGVIKVLPHVNVEEITAWKNGFFHFDHTSLEETMRQLARWYDVDVEYKGSFGDQSFVGKIQRNLDLPDVLKGLENEHVHFRMAGRRLQVIP